MKRGLVFSLCALALAAHSTSAWAQATINASLNLRYTDPADPSEGGTWQLVAKTDDVDGIAALRVVLTNVGFAGASLNTGIGAITMDVGNPPGAPIRAIGTSLEVLYGQDLTVANTVLDVGNGVGTPGALGNDILRNATWNNAALLASGLFGATRPTFSLVAGETAGGNTLVTPLPAAAIAATLTTTVRGDSLTTSGLESPAGAGLRRGDANRDGSVNSDDFDLLAFNFGLAAGAVWGQGDFNDSGSVNSDDFDLLAFNFGAAAPPAPAIGAVPEPATLALVGIAACGLLIARRRF